MWISCVRPGVLLTRASCFCPHSAFIALDLPALERPAKVISGRPSAGSCVIFAHDIRNSALTNGFGRSEEHTSELQYLMRISYAVFCLKKKHAKSQKNTDTTYIT